MNSSFYSAEDDADDDDPKEHDFSTETYYDDDELLDEQDLLHSASNERDEYHEVEKTTQTDTIRLQLWRVVVTIVLLAVTLAVTVTTYYVLERENEENFENAFRDIATLLDNAAVQQAQDVQADMHQLAVALRQQQPTMDVSALEPRYPSALVAVVPQKAAYEEAYATRIRPVEDTTPNNYYPIYQTVPVQPEALHWNADSSLNSSITTLDYVISTRNPWIAPVILTNATAANAPENPLAMDTPYARYFLNLDKTVATASTSSLLSMAVPLVNFIGASLVPPNVRNLVVKLHNTCNQTFVYELQGPTATYVGHTFVDPDQILTRYEMQVNLWGADEEPQLGECALRQAIYPTRAYRDDFAASRTPQIFAATVAVTFILVALVFAVYDFLVNERNKKIVENAARSNAIVTQLFPGTIREQIVARKQAEMRSKKSSSGKPNFLKSFVEGKDNYDMTDTSTKPVAELFLGATIIFADIVGFTAWSSVREPAQVFTLLETLFAKFDELAKRRRVFKVETVGDCYVAATGLPEPRQDHAIIMVRFASDILDAMHNVTRDLEVSLGPDTSDLDLRIGIHSGQVTAGVLRGERPRLQLFGDAMNTTARIESSSKPGKIHMSKETAELVIAAGKGHWIDKREQMVEAKGKGILETYWLRENYNRRRGSTGNESSEASDVSHPVVKEVEDSAALGAVHSSEKTNRLLNWNYETLLRLLKQIIGRREAVSQSRTNTFASTVLSSFSRLKSFPARSDYLKEVREIITFPEFDSIVDMVKVDPEQVNVPAEVSEQLRTYICCIADMYKENAFHNFEHASHVLMSVTKLMSRIIAPSHLDAQSADALHDHTYGITSDPLTQFACAFSALIHDVDHTGVPNAQLIKENAEIAGYYNNRSVAEQNSLDLAWRLLMDPQFDKLRDAICDTEDDLSRFRKLVINSVMATDIVDKELKQLRNQRWDKAFHPDLVESQNENKRDATNRKATIVIEHLIQASDVAHTMQHWHVYRKWNERFFMECYAAYKSGRAENDPSTNWYQGELGFFDFYIIPLAKKLKECGVFGVSSGEYLDYAMRNRQEWEAKGKDIVETMVEKLHGGA